MISPKQRRFRDCYHWLARACGSHHWWPAQSRFEVIVGAYLTQNTGWSNVQLALRRLRSAGRLNLKGIRECSLAELESLVQPSGYFRQKARNLKTFVAHIDSRYRGSLHQLFKRPTGELRTELLGLRGIGPETADSILIYAGQRPVFVVDAYTRRILERHSLMQPEADYEDIREFCETALAEARPPTAPADSSQLRTLPGAHHKPSPMSRSKRGDLAQIFNDMHGFMVGIGKNYCLKSQPKCDKCPLQSLRPPMQ